MIKTDLTIIIVNWNNQKILEDCLNSIYRTQINYNYQIIVVDNHSEDGSVELIKNKFPKVTLIENDKNYGYAKANNHAIKIAKTEYILLLNNDTIITQNDCFNRMVQFMKNNPKIGALGCKLLFVDGSLQSLGNDYTTVWSIFKRQILFSGIWKKYLRKKEDVSSFVKVDWILGACLLTTRTVIEGIGMLKEEYFMIGEDVEFCYRAKKAGWEVGVLASESIIHLMGKSSEKKPFVTFYHAINNNLENIKNFYGSRWKMNLAKTFYLVGILMRTVFALFSKDKKASDYLELFVKVLDKRNKQHFKYD